MKRITWTVAVAAAVGIACASQPANAATPCARDYALAKVVHQGDALHPITGLGTVTLQVLVNADKTFKVIRIIKSTNPGDNAAAQDIAGSSSYNPAMCGTVPQTSFYDFVLKFGSTTAATGTASSLGGSPADRKIEAMVRSGDYSGATAAAQRELSAHPSDAQAEQLLGVSMYYSAATNQNDMVGSAAAFSKAPEIQKSFQAIAAQSLAAVAVKLSTTDQPTALSYAKKAMAISPNFNSQFALGVVQLGDPSTAATGVAALESVRAKLASDPNLVTDPKQRTNDKIAVDQRLLNAYLAQGDMAHATPIADEMKAVDPTSNVAAQTMGAHFIQQGYAKMNAKDFTGAVPLFDQAATYDDNTVRVTAYTQAALALVNTQKDSDLLTAQGYTQKALAIAPEDAEANFIAGVVETFVWASSHKDTDKAQATDYLTKADANAKKASNAQLASQVEAFQAAHFSAAPSH